MVYTLLSAVFAGIYNFMLKVVAERGYNNYLFTFWDYLFATITTGIALVYYLTQYTISIDIFYMTSLFATITTIFFILSVFTRVESMRNIDTVIFYPLYKTFGPIMVTGVSILFFHETLSLNEIWWIVLWICVPLLLLTKAENKIQKNLLLWVWLIIATAILSTISTIGTKWIMFYGLNVVLFLFVRSFIWVIFSGISYKIHKYKRNETYNNIWMLSFCFWASLLHIGSSVFFVLALSWNLAVVFTINSFHILIPIILSIIFYGEHFNMKKGIVIALSIVSILMFL